MPLARFSRILTRVQLALALPRSTRGRSGVELALLRVHLGTDLLQAGRSLHVITRHGDLIHAPLDGTLHELLSAEGAGVALLNLVANRVQSWHIAISLQTVQLLHRLGYRLLHLRLLHLGAQLSDLLHLILQAHLGLLLLRLCLLRSLHCAGVQLLGFLQLLLHRHQLGGENFRGLVEILGLCGITSSCGLVGLVSLPGGLLMGLAGPIVGRLYDANGIRILIIPGSLVLASSMFGFAMLTEDSTVWHLLAYTIGLNLGIALMLTPLMSNALASVPDQLASHGQAILNTFQQVAGGAGTAVFVAVMTFGSAAHAQSNPGVGEVAILNHGIHVAFLLGAAISVVAVLFSIVFRFDVLRDAPKREAAQREAAGRA